MTEPVEPKPSGTFRGTDICFLTGFLFFVLGLSGDNSLAFLAIALAFIAIGVAGRAYKPKGDQ